MVKKINFILFLFIIFSFTTFVEAKQTDLSNKLDKSWNTYVEAVNKLVKENKNSCNTKRMEILNKDSNIPVKYSFADLKKEKLIDHSGPHIILKHTNDFSHFIFTRQFIKNEPEDSPVFGQDISNISHKNLDQYYPGLNIEIQKNNSTKFEAYASDDGADVFVDFHKVKGDLKIIFTWEEGYSDETDNINKITIYSICEEKTNLNEQKEIAELNQLLKKGYENYFVPYVYEKSSSNKFTCEVTKYQYKENKNGKLQNYIVPQNERENLNFQTSDDFHFTTLKMGGEEIGLYYKSTKLNQKKLIGDDDIDKIKWQFNIPNKSNNYKYRGAFTGLKKNKMRMEADINFNTLNNYFEVILQGPDYKNDLGYYYISFQSKCDGQLMALGTKNKKENINLTNDKIVGYYEGELMYPDRSLPVLSEIYFNNNKILEGKYYFKDFEGEQIIGNLSSFELNDKNRFNIKWKDKYGSGWLKVLLVGNDFDGKFGIRPNETTGYWSGYKVSLSAFNTEKNNLFKIQNKNKKTQKIDIVTDTNGPRIQINKEFSADQNFTALIKGLVTDESEIVFVSIDGKDVSINNGKISSSIYVPPKGKNVEVVAIDNFGNKSSKNISTVRSEIKVANNTFDFLDPRKIKVKINNNAVAIIIGIEEYQNTFAAPYAENDALSFNDFAHTSLGVPQQNIKLLTNDKAGRTNTIKTLVQWLPKIVSDKSDIYIFYSGHGLASEDGEDLYLLPADGDPELLKDSTILRNQLFDRIAKLNPKSVTVFLDTCYSGGTRSDELLVASRPIFIEAEEQDVPVNFTIFSASAAKETAKVLNEAEHGLFSYYMMKGLEGEADSNNDRIITNGELHAFINKNVSRQANQTPQLNGDPEQVLVQW